MKILAVGKCKGKNINIKFISTLIKKEGEVLVFNVKKKEQKNDITK